MINRLGFVSITAKVTLMEKFEVKLVAVRILSGGFWQGRVVLSVHSLQKSESGPEK